LASGGTSETAIATPGSVSEISLRDSAKAPARPVASAAIRSRRCGDVRIMTCWIASGFVNRAIGSVRTNPTAIAIAIPARLTSSELKIALRSPMLTLYASPMIGSINGATIIAPITTATESPRSPNVAMAAASTSRQTNLTNLKRSCAPSNTRTSLTRDTSSASTGPPCRISPSDRVMVGECLSQAGSCHDGRMAAVERRGPV